MRGWIREEVFVTKNLDEVRDLSDPIDAEPPLGLYGLDAMSWDSSFVGVTYRCGLRR